MVNFLFTPPPPSPPPPYSRIALTVAMETMHFFIVQLSLSLRTKILCISGVPMNDLAPMKKLSWGGGCKVGQISSRGIRHEYCIRKTLSEYKYIPSYTPLSYSKTGVRRDIPIFLIFALKHTLVITASARRF